MRIKLRKKIVKLKREKRRERLIQTRIERFVGLI